MDSALTIDGGLAYGEEMATAKDPLRERLDGFEGRVNARLHEIETNIGVFTKVVKVVGSIVAIVVTLFGIWLGILIHGFQTEVGGFRTDIGDSTKDIDKKFDRLDHRVERIEDRVFVGAASDLMDQTKELAAAGEAESAAAVASELSRQLKLDAAKKVPASPIFFKNAVHTVTELAEKTKSPELRPTLFDISRELATFRSALQTPPPATPPDSVDTISEQVYSETPPKFKRSIWNLQLPPGKIFFRPKDPNADLTKRIASFADLQIQNGTARLDGIAWTRVAFVNMHIIYEGGYLNLQDVIFYNCTFEARPGKRAAEFLNSVALDRRDVVIQGDT